MSRSIVYLHGFNSSPQSEKARKTQSFFKGSAFEVYVPALSPDPLEAIEQVRVLVKELGVESLAGFVGSSLGGYYALYLHRLFKLPSVLINPAVKPYELLQDYLGENTNMYTGETYLVEPRHMEALKSLEVEIDPRETGIYLLTQTQDETLDFKQATQKLSGVKTWIFYGGDHAFQHFDQVLPSIKSFFENS